jgi:hypothetical protein
MLTEEPDMAHARARTRTRTRTTSCASCGTPSAPGWEFCGGCGSTVAGSGNAAGGPTGGADIVVFPTRAHPVFGSDILPARTTRGSRWARRPRWMVPVALGVAVSAAVGSGVRADLDVRSRLDATRGELASTRIDLERTSATLRTTEADLVATDGALVSATTERDALEADLDARLAELEGVRGSLGDARSRLDLQAGQIETLKSCLNGVSSALSFAAYEDFVSAMAALDAVQVSCDRASDLF